MNAVEPVASICANDNDESAFRTGIWIIRIHCVPQIRGRYPQRRILMLRDLKQQKTVAYPETSGEG